MTEHYRDLPSYVTVYAFLTGCCPGPMGGAMSEPVCSGIYTEGAGWYGTTHCDGCPTDRGQGEGRAMSDGPNCCCRWGAAVAGEWPEFQCPSCERHRAPFMADTPCKRHRGQGEADSAGAGCPTGDAPPGPNTEAEEDWVAAVLRKMEHHAAADHVLSLVAEIEHLRDLLDDDEEYEFYARPENQELAGPPHRRREVRSVETVW